MNTEQMTETLANVPGMDRLLGYLRNGRGTLGRPGYLSPAQVQGMFRARGAAEMGLTSEQAEAAIAWATR